MSDNSASSYFFCLFVYVHIKRALLVDLSFGDTAILVKNGEKNEKSSFYHFVYWEGRSISWHTDIFDSAVFSGDIAQNMKNEKGRVLSMSFFPLYS